MALLDGRLEFSDGQAVTSISSGSTTISTDVIDFGASATDGWGSTLKNNTGGDLRWHVRVNVALVGAGAAIHALLQTHTTATTTSGTTIATIVIPALSASGWKRSMTVPTGGMYRYLGVGYKASGAKLTSATFDSWLGFGDDQNPAATL